MQTISTGLALVLAVVAVAVAGYAVVQDRSGPVDLEERLDAIGERIARVEQAVAARETQAEEESGPTLVGRLPLAGMSAPGRTTPTPAAAPDLDVMDGAPVDTGDETQATQQIQALVDEAVDKKALEIHRMRDKKPSIDVFTETLQLTDDQRRTVEQEVLRGQREIQTILEMPAADGTVFMDEFVEVLAEGIAHPGQRSGRGMKLFGRLLSENVPGTEETYATQVESVKSSVRATFRRDWTKEQYARFEAWEMDPTEIKEIEYSPWKTVERRVIDRARALGAEIPDHDE